MSYVLIGSAALEILGYPTGRTVKDRDYLRYDHLKNTPNHKIKEELYHPNFGKWEWKFGHIASLNELYTIKVSHSFWDLKNNSWQKHMVDIVKMKAWGATLIPELYDLLYPIWEERYRKKEANLNMSKEDFFNDAVTRPYDHDSIHESIAYGESPLFNEILTEPNGVKVSQTKFEALPQIDKERLVREEVYATALERVLIPQNKTDHISALKAYDYALKALITTQTKGWFPLWIVDNYDRVRVQDVNYVQKFLKNKHKLRPGK